MLDRVATATQTSAILANLLAAESAQTAAGDKVSSGKNGSDLKDFATQAETLTAIKSLDSRITNYQAQNSQIAAKLTAQDEGLTAVSGAAAGVNQAIQNALASGDASSLIQEIQSQFSTALSGLNTQFDGKYVFAGGQVNTAPVSATQLSDLTSGPPISSFFKNDSLQVQAKFDDNTPVTTGPLASNLATPLLNAFQAIEAFNQGPNGPLSGPLTAAQTTFLTNQIQTWTTVATNLTTQTAQNGLVQTQVSDVAANLVTQQNTLTSVIGNITDADIAKAATDLSNAQLSVQASAKVLQALQGDSLISLLPVA